MCQRPPPSTRSCGVGRHRGRAQPQVVVEALGHGLGLGLAAAGPVGRDDVDRLQLADVAVAHQLAGEAAVPAERPLLRAVLEHGPVLMHGRPQGLVLLHAEAQRLLARTRPCRRAPPPGRWARASGRAWRRPRRRCRRGPAARGSRCRPCSPCRSPCRSAGRNGVRPGRRPVRGDP